MARIVDIAEGFWNVRGSFKLFGLLNIGTQSSLARLSSGGFALLDCYPFEGEVEARVHEITDGGRRIEAIFNLHPFHTVHVEAVSAKYPHARLYGTKRHVKKAPRLRWEDERTDSERFAELFAEDFDFMVPDGVELIPDNDLYHFASILAFHRASRTLHVDDTLNWMPLPWGSRLAFHPTLGRVLYPRSGAADEFRQWTTRLVERCRDVEHVCTAHARLAPRSIEGPGEIARRVQEAAARVESTLAHHASKHG